MMHKMRLVDFAFKAIKNREKDIELRLNDEKRQLIKVGDIIEFIHIDSGKTLRTKVVKLYKYNSFKEIFENLDYKRFGVKDNNYNIMYDFYTKDEEEKYGVLGIEIELL